MFGAIATTLQERAVLEHLRRYDRLGLDAELGNFLESARAGRAIELMTIAPLLEKLASDEALMDRVRGRAGTVLGVYHGEGGVLRAASILDAVLVMEFEEELRWRAAKLLEGGGFGAGLWVEGGGPGGGDLRRG